MMRILGGGISSILIRFNFNDMDEANDMLSWN